MSVFTGLSADVSDGDAKFGAELRSGSGAQMKKAGNWIFFIK